MNNTGENTPFDIEIEKQIKIALERSYIDQENIFIMLGIEDQAKCYTARKRHTDLSILEKQTTGRIEATINIVTLFTLLAKG